MLEVVIMLALIALVFIFLRAGRQNTVVYRRKVADYDRDRFVADQPQTSSTSPDTWSGNDTYQDNAGYDAFAFGGGDFGGAGAGDSYDSGGNEWNNDSGSDSNSCDSSSDSSCSDSSDSGTSCSSSD